MVNHARVREGRYVGSCAAPPHASHMLSLSLCVPSGALLRALEADGGRGARTVHRDRLDRRRGGRRHALLIGRDVSGLLGGCVPSCLRRQQARGHGGGRGGWRVPVDAPDRAHLLVLALDLRGHLRGGVERRPCREATARVRRCEATWQVAGAQTIGAARARAQLTRRTGMSCDMSLRKSSYALESFCRYSSGSDDSQSRERILIRSYDSSGDTSR